MTHEDMKRRFEGADDRTILITNAVDIYYISQRLQQGADVIQKHDDAIAHLKEQIVTREQCSAHHASLMKNFIWICSIIMGAATIAATLLSSLIRARF